MSSTSPEPEEQEHLAKVVSIVTHHTLIAGPVAAFGAKSKVSKPKDKKEVKTKEFNHKFEKSEDSYLGLLRTILAKHGHEQYNITQKMVYTIKVQLPGVKKGEALDVEDFGEYTDLAKEIVKALPKRGQDSDEEDINGENPGLYDSNGLSELDRSLAHFRGILEKKYQNDHDSGYTYIDPSTGKSHPLSPQMMKEWSRSMHDGETDSGTPPSHWGLGVANGPRSAALHPDRIAAGVNAAPPGQGSADLAHLATIISSIMGQNDQVPRTPPKAATVNTKQAVTTSPVIPTPSKLPRFLDHAATKLGIASARSPMRRNGFGPDILHMLPDQDLVDIGLNKGDALRLKAGAQEWWKGPDAKKKRSRGEMEAASSSGSKTPAFDGHFDATPPSKKVSFKRRWDDGGSTRYYGPRIIAGNDAKGVFYCCPIRERFVPMPLGYRSTTEEEMPTSDDDEQEMDIYNPPDLQNRSDADRANDAAEVLASLNHA
ncbi:hypothetical protein B0H13DRAFT_1890539 [Mycena leptocephala]|nr:hypothetical protein B0H13DRAFT_1890539 [Mycena leptocephala]